LFYFAKAQALFIPALGISNDQRMHAVIIGHAAPWKGSDRFSGKQLVVWNKKPHKISSFRTIEGKLEEEYCDGCTFFCENQ